MPLAAIRGSISGLRRRIREMRGIENVFEGVGAAWLRSTVTFWNWIDPGETLF